MSQPKNHRNDVETPICVFPMNDYRSNGAAAETQIGVSTLCNDLNQVVVVEAPARVAASCSGRKVH